MKDQYDLLIVGGGLIGATLALALQHKPIRIGIIDNQNSSSSTSSSLQELRSLALSFISKRIFTALNIWPDIQPQAFPIRKIHISDRGHFGFARIDAQEQQVDALGYVVPLDYLKQILLTKLKQQSTVTFLDAQVKAVQTSTSCVEIATHEHKTISSKLLVVCDGSHSNIRELLQIKVAEQNYQQHAIVANVGLQNFHENVAYERFTTSGPIALLPLAEKCYSLVWTIANQQLQTYMQYSDKEFISQLQKEFGYRLGRFTWVGPRQSFPLRLVRAKEQIRERIALIGNACQTVHPVAGQGFNLGLRDVAMLAQIISEDLTCNDEIGNFLSLQKFANKRADDQSNIINFTHGLISIFANNFPPLSLLRNLGLVGMDLSKISKRWLSRKAMGYDGCAADLALGLPLTK